MHGARARARAMPFTTESDLHCRTPSGAAAQPPPYAPAASCCRKKAAGPLQEILQNPATDLPSGWSSGNPFARQSGLAIVTRRSCP